MSKTRVLKIAIATSIVILIVGVVYLMRFNYLNGQKGQYFSSPSWAPILEIGDSWKLALRINENEYNLTMTVTGEETLLNASCYTVKLIFEPESPFAEKGMFNEMTAWLDKSTLNIMKVKGKGFKFFGFTYIEEHSYIFQGAPSLTVGNEYKETHYRRMYAIIDLFSRKIPLNETTTTTWIKVEEFENITVPAGTFSCYKMVTYDETGENILLIRWFSMEAKTAVRIENYGTGEFEFFETAELLSYSLR